jgi:hypothetical protein
VLDATLNQRAWTEHLDYRLVQRLGAVDYDQQRTTGVQAVFD